MKKIIAAIIVGLCFGSIAFAEVDPRIELVTLDEPFTAQWNGQCYVRRSPNDPLEITEDGFNLPMEFSENGFDYVKKMLPIPYIPYYGNGINLLVADKESNSPDWYMRKTKPKNSPLYILDNAYNVIDTVEFEGYLTYLGFRDGYHYLQRSNYEVSGDGGYYKTANGVDWIEVSAEEGFAVTIKSNNYLQNGYRRVNEYDSPEEEGKPQPKISSFYVDQSDNYYKITMENPNFSRIAGTAPYAKDIFSLILIKIPDNETYPMKQLLSLDCVYGVEFPEDADFGIVRNNDEYVYVSKQVMYNEPRTQYYRLPMSALQNNIIVRLQDKRLGFETPPVVEDDYTLVPMRFLFEQMGAEVEWNQQTKTATLHRQGDAVTFTVDNKTATVNGAPKTMAVPARLVNDKTMVPLRFLSEELGMAVEWDNETRTAVIA